MIDRLVAGGHLVRVAAGIFLINGAPESWQRRVLLERLSAGPDDLVSHRTAAALYDLDGFDPHRRTVHLTVPTHRQSRRRKDVRLHRCRDYGLIQHWMTACGHMPARGVGGLPPCGPIWSCTRRSAAGKAHHFTDEAFEADPVRDADLAIAGWIIIHVTWAQIRNDPAGVVRRIRLAISRRGGVAA